MRSSRPQRETLESLYGKRYLTVLKPLAASLAVYVSGCFKDQPRIDRITARAKDIESFLKKAAKRERGKPKYSEPLSQIQDQVGSRIVTFYRSDVEALDSIVKKYFRPIEFKDHIPESEWEFGYFGRHYVLIVPSDVVDPQWDQEMVPSFFELQVKTLFQHAWSEAEHDLGYKPGNSPLNLDQKRRLAFTSAQAWGADRVFEELFKERNA